jgi:(R)-2-hydroxyacyl-CoA dehydratese activating ATPase
MIRLGLDVGSRTTALVRYDGRLVDSVVVATGIRPLERCRELLSETGTGRLMVTGYGRHLVAPALGGEVLSEISAAAVGVSHFYPDAASIIDIGGQDSKVIALSNGEVTRFEMNDRCAAGTGRFLEVMADTLGVAIDEFGALALRGKNGVPLNSQCTVFAESEVISLIARGESPATIALSLHQSVANRIIGMVRRVGVRGGVVFIGGVARNPCIRKLLGELLSVSVTVPDDPQIMAALGAAICLKEGESD